MAEMEKTSIRNDSANAEDHVTPAMKTLVKWMERLRSRGVACGENGAKNQLPACVSHKTFHRNLFVPTMRISIFYRCPVSTALHITLHKNCFATIGLSCTP